MANIVRSHHRSRAIRETLLGMGLRFGDIAAMTITLAWYNDSHTILLVTYDTGFSWEEYDQMEAAVSRVLDGCPIPVDVLIDFRLSVPPLDYARRLSRMALSSPFLHHPMAGHIIVSSPTRFMRSLLYTFDMLFNTERGKLHYVPSVRDGLRLLDEIHRTDIAS